MNSSESFKKPSTPENAKQHIEYGDYVGKHTVLIGEAKAKVEGVLLYAPLPETVKKRLLERLDSVPTDDSNEVRAVFKERDLTDEQRASLWVDRWMRGVVATIQPELDGRNHQMLLLALDRLWTNSGNFEDSVAAWIDSGKKPPNK